MTPENPRLGAGVWCGVRVRVRARVWRKGRGRGELGEGGEGREEWAPARLVKKCIFKNQHCFVKKCF